MEKTLEIKNLAVRFRETRILRGVNFSVGEHESLALVGESGSGKTITARSVMRLLPRNMYFEKGEILIHGINVTELQEKELTEIRGRRAGMIFQEPSSYLNPVFTAGSQIAEAIKNGGNFPGSSPLRGEGAGATSKEHRIAQKVEMVRPLTEAQSARMVGVKGRIGRFQRKERVLKMLDGVGLKENVYYQYPHQLSGGMQQRVMIAMALINSPDLLIADEPTTALDVTTAYGIIELLKEMMARYGLSLLFITHDISLAVNFAGRIAVMYAGKVVELASAKEIFSNPLHPYTEKLISCLPERYRIGDRIQVIEGQVPDFKTLPQGCAFHPRCPYKMKICLLEDPGEMRKGDSTVRCFRYGNVVETG